jgi:hypothetical protein
MILSFSHMSKHEMDYTVWNANLHAGCVEIIPQVMPSETRRVNRKNSWWGRWDLIVMYGGATSKSSHFEPFLLPEF